MTPEPISKERRSASQAGFTAVKRAILAVLLFIAAAGCDRTGGNHPPAGTGLSRNDIIIRGMQLRSLGKGSYEAVGRLTNISTRHTLREVTLTFTMEDVSHGGDAAVIASATVPMRYEIPPDKSAYFRERISFGSLTRPAGRHEWNYSITAINGVSMIPARKVQGR